MSSTRRWFLFRPIALALVLAAFGSQSAQAQFRPVEDGPIHEAFVPAIAGISALEAIPTQPPPVIIERPPASCDAEAIWIKGYWSYDDDIDDFQWVGGCWRRPPRGHHWVEGFWHPLEEGWVWIRGFWSPVPGANLVFIDDAPPDPVDEDSPTAVGSNYFWLAGYWGYQPGRGYVQFAGRWIEMDPNLILVPASYTWRPEGYVFLPAYWDWPLERRGCTYQTVYVEPAARVVELVYEPVVVVEPAVVVGWCYSYYPNYVYFVHHHYHHHHDWWYAHYEVPTWWGWHGWWSMSWHDHWGTWWWWSHPGYPHPHFMTAAYAARIAPPHKNVFKIKNVYAPKIITVNGVVSSKETLKGALKDKSKGKVVPVVAATTKDKLHDGKKDKDNDKDGKDHGDKGDKGDKKDKNDNKGIAKAGTLMPTGSKSAKDEEKEDPKSQPPKPGKKQPNLVTNPNKTGGTSGNTGIVKGKDKDGKDKDDEKPKNKSGPPITVKGQTGDSDGKKNKSDDKPDKTGDKSRPPIVPSGQMKDKDKDKPKGNKDDDKPPRSGGSSLPGTDSKPKDNKDKDKPQDSGFGKKGSGNNQPPIDLKPKENKDKDKPQDSGSSKKGGGNNQPPIDLKPKENKDKDKPQDSGSGKKGGGNNQPPIDLKPKENKDKPPTGGGGDKNDKDKKKDKNGRN